MAATTTTVAAIGHLIRGTPGRAVQITSWTTDMGVTAEAVLQTGATAATAHPTAHPVALLAVPLTAPLTTTGPPTALGSSPPLDAGPNPQTALGSSPPPDAGPNPQTPTAGIALQRDRPAAPRSLLWMSLY